MRIAARPVTTYETYLYSVAIPDALGLAPPDGELLWSHPAPTYAGAGSDRSVLFNVHDVEACSHASMQAIADSFRGTEGWRGDTEVQTRDFPVGPAVVLSGMSGPATSDPVRLTWVFACDEHRLVSLLGWGLDRAEAASIMEGFRFRVPSGDPLQPPSPGS